MVKDAENIERNITVDNFFISKRNRKTKAGIFEDD